MRTLRRINIFPRRIYLGDGKTMQKQNEGNRVSIVHPSSFRCNLPEKDDRINEQSISFSLVIVNRLSRILSDFPPPSSFSSPLSSRLIGSRWFQRWSQISKWPVALANERKWKWSRGEKDRSNIMRVTYRTTSQKILVLLKQSNERVCAAADCRCCVDQVSSLEVRRSSSSREREKDRFVFLFK